MIQVGDVIQVKETIPAWGGCLMIVDEVKQWGIQCIMRLPGRNPRITALRLSHSEYYPIETKAKISDLEELMND